jgi:hypothetical protein
MGWHYLIQGDTFAGTKKGQSANPSKQVRWRPILLHACAVMFRMTVHRLRTGVRQSVWFIDNFYTVHGNIAWYQCLLVQIISPMWFKDTDVLQSRISWEDDKEWWVAKDSEWGVVAQFKVAFWYSHGFTEKTMKKLERPFRRPRF